MNPLIDFMEKAKGFAKNPLGIIALFVSLIYGFACMVLSSSLKNLVGSSERLPLIWFIIVFPVFILTCFIYLVVNHHEKLYAPSDFKDEANFIKTLDAKKQTKRIQSEVDAISKDIEETSALENQKGINKPLVQVDKKTIQNKYLIAEDLALRAFEQSEGLTIKRQVRITNQVGKTIEFDGVGFDKRSLYGIDVKFTVHGLLSKMLRDRIERDTTYYSKALKDLRPGADFKFVLIVVTESNNYSSLKESLSSLVDNSEFKFNFIVYNFTELKNRFGIE